MHVDAYRLSGGLDEMEDLDLDVSLPESVVVVEWGEGKVEELTEDRLHVVIHRAVGDTTDEVRHVTVRGWAPAGPGPSWGRCPPERSDKASAQCCVRGVPRGHMVSSSWLGIPNQLPAFRRRPCLAVPSSESTPRPVPMRDLLAACAAAAAVSTPPPAPEPPREETAVRREAA